MCLACEEQEYFFRVWCVGFLARGEMPPGVTMEDLEAMGLPPPKTTAGGPDAAAANPSASNESSTSSKPAAPAANAFACDSPDE
jgi:hypothetical protein